MIVLPEALPRRQTSDLPAVTGDSPPPLRSPRDTPISDAAGPQGSACHRNQSLDSACLISIAQLMIVLDVTIVNIALPSARQDLGTSDGNRQWVVTAYALAFGGLLLVGGRIADLWGPDPLLHHRPDRLRIGRSTWRYRHQRGDDVRGAGSPGRVRSAARARRTLLAGPGRAPHRPAPD